MAGPGRPLGEISVALLAAAQAAPGTVPELAARALVGRLAARFKAKDLVRAGHLVVIRPGRPRVLGLPVEDDPQPGAELAAVLAGWGR